LFPKHFHNKNVLKIKKQIFLASVPAEYIQALLKIGEDECNYSYCTVLYVVTGLQRFPPLPRCLLKFAHLQLLYNYEAVRTGSAKLISMMFDGSLLS
jgi:hypothetical protein